MGISNCFRLNSFEWFSTDSRVVSQDDTSKVFIHIGFLPFSSHLDSREFQMKRQNIEAIYPLSSMQEGMLFHSLYAPYSGMYCEQIYFTVRGIDKESFKRAWERVIARHEVLRSFVWVGTGKPSQVVCKSVKVSWHEEDWGELNSEEQRSRLEVLLKSDRTQGFDVARPPLMRFSLIHLSQQKYQFVWSFHHLILDGWSIPTVLKEVFVCSAADMGGEEAILPKVRPYQDYIAWLLQRDLGKAEEYWREALKGVEGPTRLGMSRTVGSGEGYGRRELAITGERWERIQKFAREQRLTVNTLVQAGWGWLLSRYSGGEKDVVFGATVAGRPGELAGVERMVGVFINTLPVRVRMKTEDGEKVVEWLRRLQAEQVEMRQYEYAPLVEVQSWSAVPRGLPLFESIVVFENYPVEESAGDANTSVEIRDLGTFEKTNYPLHLLVAPGAALLVRLTYERSRFADEVMERVLRQLGVVLDGMVEHAEEEISRLPLMSEQERLEVLEKSRGEAKEYGDKERCVHELVAREASRHAERVAVVCEGEGISYGELNRRANQLGRYLRQKGVGPEVLVGIAMERSVEMVVGVLGILKAGGAYVPLDVEYPKERLRYMLEDSGVQVLVSETAVLQRLPESVAGVDVVRMDEEEERKKIAEESGEDFESGVGCENLAYMIYTSGSTGKPKGAMNEHGGLTNRLLWMQERFGLGEEDVVLQKTPISFDVSVWELLWAVMVGGRLVMARPGGHREGRYLAEVIAGEKVTTLHFVPSMLQAFLQEEGLEEKCRSVKRVMSSGEALGWELQERFYERMGASGAKLYNLYGPTEAAIDVTCWECEPGVGGGVVPIGRAIANVQMYVLDEKQEVVPEGVSGELYIGGVQVGRGYWKREELTGERFIRNPYGEGRLYRTGDVGRYVGDGVIEYQGRGDEQVKVRGYRIELGEIEAVLQEHAGVREAAVVVREVRGAGETEAGTPEKRLVGYVVLAGGVKTSELRRYLKERLPEYMVPGVWVEMERLPVTANGKLDRKNLPEPGGERPELESGYEEPQTETEKKLAEIWAQVLGVEEVGVHDNFFDLGGDSIMSLQIISRANQLGMGVSVRELFQSQTIAELAEAVESGSGSGEGRDGRDGRDGSVKSGKRRMEGEQGMVEGEVELTPIQRWFFEQELAEAGHWNQAVLLETAADVEVERLREALGKVVEQHDALRMRYVREAEGNERGPWKQIHGGVGEGLGWEFAERDLSGVSDEDRVATVERVVEEEQKRLDLERGPVFRAVLMGMGEGRRGRLLLVAHHLVIDGVSWRIVLGDLGRAYEQLRRGEGVELGKKTTSYQQWAKRLAEYGRSEEIRKEQEYWVGMEVERAGRLPVELDGENVEAAVEVVTKSLSEAETARLLQQVPEVYHTQINDVLLTALGEAVGQWTGSDEVLVDVEGHGREEIGAEGVDVTRTVGWFTTIYPVMVERSGSASGNGNGNGSGRAGVGKGLKRVKEQLRGMPGRGMGYGLLRYGVGNEEIAKKLREKQPAEVLFNYLGQFDARWDGGTFGPATEKCGGSRSGKAKRRYVVEIAGGVFGGRLQMHWMYSGEVHRRETIEAVAEGYQAALLRLIEHCLSPEAGGYTPSDFPLARWNQAELDRVIGGREKEIEDVYGLSSTQEGMLFHILYSPQSGVYFQQLMLSLEGAIDPRLWEQAWQQVVERHAALRTSFAWEELEHAVQVVHEHVELKVEEQDWSADDETTQRERLSKYVESERERGFDLTEAPLMRLALIRTGERRYRFVWSWSHLLLDGWCLPVILQEAFGAYQALASGQRWRMPQAEPYRKYMQWLQRQDVRKAEGYWREALSGSAGPTRLGMSRTVRSGEGYGQRELEITGERWERIQKFAREQRLTVNTLVQAAWGWLLSRYSGGEKDVVFGATVAGRPGELAGVERMVGVFINTLPVRVRMKTEDGEKVVEWLQRLQAEQVEMRQYEYAPLVEVQSWSAVPRGLPLFESIVVFENYPVDRSKGGDAGLKVVGVEAEERTNYPLNLIAMVGEGASFRLTYERSRFADEVMERVLRQLGVVLDGMVEHAEEEISRLALMSEEERLEVLARSCGEAKEYGDKERCVHELVAREASKHPERVAVVCEGEGISYGELNRRANQLGRYLRQKGVGPEVLVGIAMERSVEMVVGVLGILKAGGAYVPLDVEYPKERLRYMLEDSGVQVLVSETAVLQRLPESVAGVDVVRMDEEEERKEIAEESGEDFESGVRGENLAYMIYTSGSTGKPKGAMNEHGGLTNRLLWMQERFGLGEEDVVLQKTPISFDVSVWELLWAVMVGGRLVMARPGGHREGRYLAEVIEGEKVTTLHFVPSMLQAFLQEEGLEEKCRSVKRVMSSGEALGWELQERFYGRMGNMGAKLYNLYGPTEAAIDVTCWECEPGVGGGVVPIGRAIANVQMYVLDEKQEVVPEGVSGELYIGGVQVGRGYWKREELTGARFIRNPYGEGRLYRTGDVGRYVGDGVIEYQGRGDEQVKVRGYRIELGEIEAVLQEHAEVREAAVVVREVRGAGETEAGTPEKRLVGYVVLAGGVKTSELRRYLKERLPEYMVPGVWVEMERLPVTANGKLDRKNLPEPGGERPELESGYEEPGTETEKKLAEIWAQVLGVEKVGVHDNFFDLGGQSLLATQIVSRTRKVLQIELPLRLLFESPTIAELANIIANLQTEQSDAILATELAELRELSEAEAQKLLEETLRAGSVQ